MKETIDKIRNFTNLDNHSIIINDMYKCEFEKPYDVTDIEVYNIFSDQVKEENCPRLSQFANVSVRELGFNQYFCGHLYIYEDLDLNFKTMTLMIKDDDAKNWTTMINVVKCEIDM